MQAAKTIYNRFARWSERGNLAGDICCARWQSQHSLDRRRGVEVLAQKSQALSSG
jgi:hypothetical protein